MRSVDCGSRANSEFQKSDEREYMTIVQEGSGGLDCLKSRVLLGFAGIDEIMGSGHDPNKVKALL